MQRQQDAFVRAVEEQRIKEANIAAAQQRRQVSSSPFLIYSLFSLHSLYSIHNPNQAIAAARAPSIPEAIPAAETVQPNMEASLPAVSTLTHSKLASTHVQLDNLLSSTLFTSTK